MQVKGRKIPPYPERLDRSQEYYDLSVRVRWVLFLPLVKLLSRLRVTASMVSYAGLLFMAPVLFFAKEQPWLAVGCVVASIFADLLDGVVARYQETCSDKGKLVDMVCDNVSFTMFMIALVYTGLIGALAGLVLTYTMLLSKVLRSITHSFFLDTDWHFKAVAGFLPNLSTGIIFLMYLIFAASEHNYLTVTGYILAVALMLDSLLSYVRILMVAPDRGE